MGRDALMAMPGKADRGGGVVSARLTTEDGVRVLAEAEDGSDCWRRIRRR